MGAAIRMPVSAPKIAAHADWRTGSAVSASRPMTSTAISTPRKPTGGHCSSIQTSIIVQ